MDLHTEEDVTIATVSMEKLDAKLSVALISLNIIICYVILYSVNYVAALGPINWNKIIF